ncbi:MAG: hypothetical protein PF961_01935 [Planctomycetota bacterium]|nr:hypothetical protein [Planctomycetota bacterium]
MVINAESSDNGSLWRLQTLACNAVTIDGTRFTITAPNGASMVGTVLVPDTVTIRRGTWRRVTVNNAPSCLYRGEEVYDNTWIEFDCAGAVTVVMTIQRGDAPTVTQRADGIEVGGVPYQLDQDVITGGGLPPG